MVWSCADAVPVTAADAGGDSAAAGEDTAATALPCAEPAGLAVALPVAAGTCVEGAGGGVASGADRAESILGPDVTATAVGAGAAAAALAGARAGEAGAGGRAALGSVAGLGPSATQATEAGPGAVAGESSCLLADSGKGTGAKGWLELLAVSTAEDGLCSGHAYMLFDVDKGVGVGDGGKGDGEGPGALLEGLDKEGEDERSGGAVAGDDAVAVKDGEARAGEEGGFEADDGRGDI